MHVAAIAQLFQNTEFRLSSPFDLLYLSLNGTEITLYRDHPL